MNYHLNISTIFKGLKPRMDIRTSMGIVGLKPRMDIRTLMAIVALEN